MVFTSVASRVIRACRLDLIFTLTLGLRSALVTFKADIHSCSGNHAVSLSTAIAIYFIIWWTVLFAVLPWGVRSQEESGTVAPGTDPGAPAIPRLGRKLIWTSIVAAIVF